MFEMLFRLFFVIFHSRRFSMEVFFRFQGPFFRHIFKLIRGRFRSGHIVDGRRPLRRAGVTGIVFRSFVLRFRVIRRFEVRAPIGGDSPPFSKWVPYRAPRGEALYMVIRNVVGNTCFRVAQVRFSHRVLRCVPFS